jgi:hypothetical protein
MLYAFFWVIPRRLNFTCRCLGTLCLFHLHRRVGMKNDWVENIGVLIGEKFWLKYPNIFYPVILHTYPPIKLEQSVPKRRHIKFRRRGITQKKTYNIQNTAKF